MTRSILIHTTREIRDKIPPPAELVTVCSRVEDFDDDLASLAEDLLARCRPLTSDSAAREPGDPRAEVRGIGLAAPQVGETVRMFVVDLTGVLQGAMPTVFVNPEITGLRGGWITEYESCLSLPGTRVRMKRPRKLTLIYQDVRGDMQYANAKYLMARAVCHELDHLDGLLLTSTTWDRNRLSGVPG